VEMLQRVKAWLGQLESRLPGDVEVPFAKDLTTKGLFDLDAPFFAAVIDPATDPGGALIPTVPEWLAGQPAQPEPLGPGGLTLFATAQELAARLGVEIATVDYDPANEELTFAFTIDQAIQKFTRTLDLESAEFDLLGPFLATPIPGLPSPFLGLTSQSA